MAEPPTNDPVTPSPDANLLLAGPKFVERADVDGSIPAEELLELISLPRAGDVSLEVITLRLKHCRGLRQRFFSTPARSMEPPWMPRGFGGRWSRCRHRRGILRNVPATESGGHYPNQTYGREHDGDQDGHPLSTSDLGPLDDHID